jgi:apolipoprotein N-acyltransferase
MDSPASALRRAMLILSAVALTAGAYFVSSGLQRHWWPVWVAPIPVLLLAPRLRAWQAFEVALIARAFPAAFNFWHYLRQVVQLPLWLVLLTILVPAATFAVAVVFYRGLLQRDKPWLATLAFPATIVAAEYLLSLSQGTFLNTGYTQLENLPVLQLASLSGLWGISFSVNLLPAGLSTLIGAPAQTRTRLAVALAACYAGILSYGMVRLFVSPRPSGSVTVGLVETHAGQNIFPADVPAAMALMQEYASQVRPLADRGAQFVVLPEMTALIPDHVSGKFDKFWQSTARDAHVQILAGILHVTDHAAYNEGRLYSASGEIETVYRKHHLVPTWESRSTPGTELSVLPQGTGKIGIEICRDMDYPELARRYGNQQVGLVLAPAWDQGLNVDAAWHGHLSLMRGVEDGFTMVRNAKVGLLTASDDRGRILQEQPTRPDGALTTMLVTVPVRHVSTLYQKSGDWFAWVDVVALAALLLVWLYKFKQRSRGDDELSARQAALDAKDARA